MLFSFWVLCTNLYCTGVGGFVALWAWVRNRRTRNRRHMQLIDEGL
jgi:hypothetical protein